MDNVRRIFVEKKPEAAVQARELQQEIRGFLGIDSVTKVRILIRYDVEKISDEVFNKALHTVFSEPPVDLFYLEQFPHGEQDACFSVEYLPGQFDQRADSAVQCIQLLSEEAHPVIRSATTYCIEGTVTEEELSAIRNFCINPVDSRETGEEKPQSLLTEYP